MNQQVLEWLRSHDTGISSRTIVAVMEGIDTPFAAALLGSWGAGYPRDPSDLGRCIRLLDLAPTYRANLMVMKSVSPVWTRLVDHWSELEALYREEEKSGRAPKCYDRMQEVIGDGR